MLYLAYCYECNVTLDLQRKVLLLFQIMILGNLDDSCMMPHSRRRKYIDQLLIMCHLMQLSTLKSHRFLVVILIVFIYSSM